MKRSTGLALASLLSTLIGSFAILAAPEAAHAGPPKVTICHKPPGNPANAHTISVSIHAWPAHQGHGDSLGKCGPQPEEEDDVEGPAGPGDSGGGGGDPDDGSGGDAGSGSSGADGFSVVLCDGRKGEQGRRIEVAGTGRVSVQPSDCD